MCEAEDLLREFVEAGPADPDLTCFWCGVGYPTHRPSSHLSDCPWARAAILLGVVEADPPAAPSAPVASLGQLIAEGG